MNLQFDFIRSSICKAKTASLNVSCYCKIMTEGPDTLGNYFKLLSIYVCVYVFYVLIYTCTRIYVHTNVVMIWL